MIPTLSKQLVHGVHPLFISFVLSDTIQNPTCPQTEIID